MTRLSTTFSIIIPAKNEEDYLSKCLGGIAELDFDKRRLEVIVVDNNSTDCTVKVAKEFGAKVIKVENGTIAKLRNSGGSAANGQFLAFIDADCIPRYDWLAKALDHFKNPNVAAVGSEPSLPEEGTTWVQEGWALMKQKPYMALTNWLSSCNFIVRKSAFDSINGFDETLETCEDADIGFRLSKRWSLINDPEVSVIHLREPKNVAEFFKKEMWHNRDNYSGLLKHGLQWHEVPSLLIPLWPLVCLMALLLSTIIFSSALAVVSIIALVSLPLVMTGRIMSRTGRFSKLISVFILHNVYCAARALSIFR